MGSSPPSGLDAGLAGKVVLVTGASSGIGQAAAIGFARAGCRVAITGRNQAGLAETSVQCQRNIPETSILSIVADLVNEQDCKRIVAETVERFGQLDVLVNNAGIGVFGSIETTSVEDYDRIMHMNTRSVLVTTQAAVPHLKKTEGNIVNVSSINGIRSFAGLLPYNMSKSALDQFTRCTAIELAQYKVRVNSVNPGVILTNIHRASGMSEEEYQKYLEHSKTTHPLGRVGRPDEVANVIVFLGSNALSGFITGVTLPIDGGWGLMCPP